MVNFDKRRAITQIFKKLLYNFGPGDLNKMNFTKLFSNGISLFT